jgi:hypothetical protein
MTNDLQNQNKKLVKQLSDAMYDFEGSNVLATLERILASDCEIHVGHPIGDMTGAS